MTNKLKIDNIELEWEDDLGFEQAKLLLTHLVDLKIHTEQAESALKILRRK